MRICVLANGSNIHTRRWVTSALSSGHEVSLISWTPCSYAPDVKVRILPMTLRRVWADLWGILAAVDAMGPDLIHAHQVTSPGLYGVVAARHRQVPVVVSAWGTDVLGAAYRPGILNQVTRYVLRNANAVTSDSAYMSGIINRWAPKTPLVTVPLGIERSVFNRLGGETKEKIILSPRQHTPLYRIDLILAASVPVLAQHPDWRLVVAGEGPESAQLKRVAESLGIAERVHFTGLIPRNDLLRWFDRATVCVSVPTHDATSVSLLEAMAAACFPIVSNLPANCEWVQQGENGSIVAGVAELTCALSEAVAMSADQRLLVGARNRAIIAKRAIFEENMNEVEAMYSALTGFRTKNR